MHSHILDDFTALKTFGESREVISGREKEAAEWNFLVSTPKMSHRMFQVRAPQRFR